jgi:serine/threonine protein kinase
MIQVDVEELVEGFLARCRSGERPPLEDFLAAHPAERERLEPLLTTLMLLEGFGRPDPAPRAAPERLDDFRLLREIGRGGMGVVHEAIQEPLGRRVALKVLDEVATRDPVILARFEREARAVATLHHTAIVPVYAVGRDRGYLWLAMPFIEGGSIERRLEWTRLVAGGTTRLGLADRTRATDRSGVESTPVGPSRASPASSAGAPVAASRDSSDRTAEEGREPLTVRRSATVAAQIARALEHAHHRGVLHRDVKPANILLDAEGRAWLADFGLATLSSETDLTRDGVVVGTPRYLAPERLDGVEGPAADIYGLGATLYEMLTLRPPFEETRRELLLAAIRFEEPAPLRSRASGVPRDLETVVARAMAKEPERRYPTAAEFADDLERFLDGRPIRARRISAFERLRLWAGRHPLAAGLAGALAAAIVVSMIAVTGLWLSADRQWRRAEAEVVAKGRALDEASRQRDLASRRLKASLTAIDRFHRDLIDGVGFEAPGRHALRRQWLVDTQAWLESLTSDDTDLHLALERIRTMGSLAQVQLALGDRERSRQTVDRAIELAEALSDAVTDTDRRLLLGRLFGQRARFGADEPEVSLFWTERAVELLEPLLERPETFESAASLLVPIHHQHAGLLAPRSLRPALMAMDRATSLLDRAAAQPNPAPWVFAERHHQLATEARLSANKEVARCERAIAAYDAIPRARRPVSVRARTDDAWVDFVRAGLMTRKRRLTEASGMIDRSIRVAELHIAQNPGVSDYLRDLAVFQRRRVSILFQSGRTLRDAAVEAAFAASISAHERAFSLDPGRLSVRRDLAIALTDRSGELRRIGRRAEALADASRSRELLLALNPKVGSELSGRLADATHNIGLTLLDQGKVQVAGAHFEEAARRQLGVSCLLDLERRRHLSYHCQAICNVRQAEGRWSEALVADVLGDLLDWSTRDLLSDAVRGVVDAVTPKRAPASGAGNSAAR